MRPTSSTHAVCGSCCVQILHPKATRLIVFDVACFFRSVCVIWYGKWGLGVMFLNGRRMVFRQQIARGTVLVNVYLRQRWTVFGSMLDRLASYTHTYVKAQCIPVLLMLGDIVSKAHEDDHIRVLGLAVFLGMICCCFHMLNTEEDAQRSAEVSDKLNTNVSEDVHWDAVWDTPVVKEDFDNMPVCCHGRWNSSRHLEVSVGNDMYVLNTSWYFGEWFHDIHWDKVEWFRCWKMLQSTLMAV